MSSCICVLIFSLPLLFTLRKSCAVFQYLKSALTLLVVSQEGHQACGNPWVCSWWWFDWSFACIKECWLSMLPPPYLSYLLP